VKHLAGDRRLLILAVRCEGELAALAPCCLRPPSLFRWRPLPVLEFLENGSVGSDYLDIIVRKAVSRSATSLGNASGRGAGHAQMDAAKAARLPGGRSCFGVGRGRLERR